MENGDLDGNDLNHGQAVIFCSKEGKSYDVTLWDKNCKHKLLFKVIAKSPKYNTKSTKKGVTSVFRKNSAALAKGVFITYLVLI